MMRMIAIIAFGLMVPVFVQAKSVTASVPRLNIRSAPAVAAPTIDQTKPGWIHRVLDEKSGWYQIELYDPKKPSSGWVMKKYLKISRKEAPKRTLVTAPPHPSKIYPIIESAVIPQQQIVRDVIAPRQPLPLGLQCAPGTIACAGQCWTKCPGENQFRCTAAGAVCGPMITNQNPTMMSDEEFRRRTFEIMNSNQSADRKFSSYQSLLREKNRRNNPGMYVGPSVDSERQKIEELNRKIEKLEQDQEALRQEQIWDQSKRQWDQILKGLYR